MNAFNITVAPVRGHQPLCPVCLMMPTACREARACGNAKLLEACQAQLAAHAACVRLERALNASVERAALGERSAPDAASAAAPRPEAGAAIAPASNGDGGSLVSRRSARLLLALFDRPSSSHLPLTSAKSLHRAPSLSLNAEGWLTFGPSTPISGALRIVGRARRRLSR